MSHIIVEIDGWLRSVIDEKGKPNKYGKPKIFKTREDAEKWVARRSYQGMSWRYDIVPIAVVPKRINPDIKEEIL